MNEWTSFIILNDLQLDVSVYSFTISNALIHVNIFFGKTLMKTLKASIPWF